MRIAMLFPGYGSQRLGMGKQLYDESRIVQEYFEQATNCLDTNFVQLCFASSDAQINKLEYAYSALFLVSSALYALLHSEGIVPDVVAGYTMGQYAALCAAGGITFADGLYFLNKFAHLYNGFLETTSVRCIRVSGVSSSELQKLCEHMSTKQQRASVAVYITDQSSIIGGHTSIVDKIDKALQKYKDSTIEPINPGVGLHSSIMNPVAEQLNVYLPKIDLKPLQIPLLSTIDAQIIQSSTQVTDAVVHQITSPIRWDLVLHKLKAYDLCIEVGPGDMLTRLAKEQYPDKQALSVHSLEGINEVKKILQEATNPTGT